MPALPEALRVLPWHGAANRDLFSRPFSLFCAQVLKVAESQGHFVSLRAGSIDPRPDGTLGLRRFGLCPRCSLGVLMHSDPSAGGRLDELSLAARLPCPGTLTYPLDPWEQAGIPGLS